MAREGVGEHTWEPEARRLNAEGQSETHGKTTSQKQKRDSKMAQWVEVLAVKPDDQNSSLKNPHGEWREQTP